MASEGENVQGKLLKTLLAGKTEGDRLFQKNTCNLILVLRKEKGRRDEEGRTEKSDDVTFHK